MELTNQSLEWYWNNSKMKSHVYCFFWERESWKDQVYCEGEIKLGEIKTWRAIFVETYNIKFWFKLCDSLNKYLICRNQYDFQLEENADKGSWGGEWSALSAACLFYFCTQVFLRGEHVEKLRKITRQYVTNSRESCCPGGKSE